MRARHALFTTLLLLAAGASGCLDDTSARDYHAAGTVGRFAVGWAYDGAGTLPFDGFITIHADPVANTGDAIIEGELNDQHWRVVFDQYAEQAGRPFQDGGIASNLDEHGDTGVGDTSIPKVRVDVAAWGEALVTVDDKPVKDPLTGGDRWVAHYMVITTGVRDDAAYGIRKSSGGAYDPKEPTNALAVEGDHEIHLVLKSHATAPPNATAIANESQTYTAPSFNARHTYSNAYQNSEFNVTLSVAGTYPPTQGVTFTLRDPNGRSIKQVTLPSGGRTEEKVTAVFNETGKYTLDVVGRGGLQMSYEIQGALTPPSNVVLNLWWEEILFGAAAEDFEATAGADHTHEASMSANATVGPKRF